MRSDGPAVSWSSRPAARRRAIRKTGRRAWRPPAAVDLWLVHWARAGIILSPRSEGAGVTEITVVHSAAAPQPKRRASALSGGPGRARRSSRTNVFLSEEQDFTRLFFGGTKQPRRTEKKSGLLGCVSPLLCFSVFDRFLRPLRYFSAREQ